MDHNGPSNDDQSDMTKTVLYTDVSMKDEWMALGYVIYEVTPTLTKKLIELGSRVINHTKLDRAYDSHRGEFRALISGIRAVTDHCTDSLLCCVDQDDIPRQVRQKDRLDDDGYFIHATHSFLGRFDEWRITAIDRDDNELAHEQARLAMKAAEQSGEMIL